LATIIEPAPDLALTDDDVALFNTRIGMRELCRNKKINLPRALARVRYETRLNELQVQLVQMQSSVISQRKRLVVLFEGRDAAGKGGAIRRITQRINPRHFRSVALAKPTEDERGQWYFQRYVQELPRPGEIVFFDRSWYNRAVVEPVNDFCTEAEYDTFMTQINPFEEMITESGIQLVKFYFSITKAEQNRRFDEIRNDPRKRWKMSPVDERAQELWHDYTKYKELMFKATNTPRNPWVLVNANDKRSARIQAIEHLLSVVPWSGEDDN